MPSPSRGRFARGFEGCVWSRRFCCTAHKAPSGVRIKLLKLSLLTNGRGQPIMDMKLRASIKSNNFDCLSLIFLIFPLHNYLCRRGTCRDFLRNKSHIVPLFLHFSRIALNEAVVVTIEEALVDRLDIVAFQVIGQVAGAGLSWIALESVAGDSTK